MSEHSLPLLLSPRQCFLAALEDPRHQQRPVSEHPHFVAERHEPQFAGRDLALTLKRPESGERGVEGKGIGLVQTFSAASRPRRLRAMKMSSPGYLDP